MLNFKKFNEPVLWMARQRVCGENPTAVEANEGSDYDRWPQISLRAALRVGEVVEVLTSEVHGQNVLTRLGFGLSSTLKFVAKVLKEVLSKEARVQQATSSYIDDILVDDG